LDFELEVSQVLEDFLESFSLYKSSTNDKQNYTIVMTSDLDSILFYHTHQEIFEHLLM